MKLRGIFKNKRKKLQRGQNDEYDELQEFIDTHREELKRFDEEQEKMRKKYGDLFCGL